jgi:hypothetical protein
MRYFESSTTIAHARPSDKASMPIYKCYACNIGAYFKLIDEMVNLGLLLFWSSIILFHLQMCLFSKFLKENCPQIWESYISKCGRANFLVRYQKLRNLPLIYESDNIEVSRKLKSLALIYKSGFVGLAIMGIGGMLDLSGIFDA